MVQIITIALTSIGVLLSILIVLQSKGNGLSLAPGSGDFGKFEKRGPEKILHMITLVLVVIFIALALALFFLAP
jgi:protein translocase SecG subunit